jgi:hypothetical protein
MPPDSTTRITAHIHVDGPIPGPHSLLTLTAVAHPGSGGPTSSFTTNLRELPGATLHPAALQTWRTRAEDWLSSRRAARPPALAMRAFTRWLDQLPGDKVFVTDTTEPDYLFLYWYLQRFTGTWPFAGTRPETAPAGLTECTSLCPLAGCRTAGPLARLG